MDDRSHAGQAERPPASAGECHACRHSRVILNDRGSRFVLCERSKADPAFRRFPPLPVRGCPGYEIDVGA